MSLQVVKLMVSILVVLEHFFNLVRVGHADEVALHVEDVSLFIHLVLFFFAFNLDPAHNLPF